MPARHPGGDVILPVVPRAWFTFYPRSMRIELTRFRVISGKEGRAHEWMDFPRANSEAFRETREPERMYVETIFSEVVDSVTYLSYSSVQGVDATIVNESSYWLDEKHMAFWQECIDPDYTPQDLTSEVHMVPERVMAAKLPLDCERGRARTGRHWNCAWSGNNHHTLSGMARP